MAETTGPTAPLVGGPARYLVLACTTAVLLSFGLHAVAPALPVVQEVFALSDFQVGLVTASYVLPGVLFAVPFGVGADLVGRRRVFAGAGVLYGTMGIVQGLAPSFAWLLAGRLLQGVAFAALMPLTVTILGDAFVGLAQVKAQAQRQITMAVAQLAMPVIGAQLAIAGWFLPFSAQGITILPALWALWVLDESRPNAADRAGYLGRAVNAIRRRGYPSVLTLGFIRFFARFAILGFLPLHLSRRLGASLTEVGVVMSMATGLAFVSAMGAARLSSRVSPSRVVRVALLATGAGLVGLAQLPSLPWVMAVAVVFAFGDGLIAVLHSAYAARGAPEDVRAGVVALDGTARNAGKFVGPIVTGAIAAWAGIAPALTLAGLFVIAAALVVPTGLALLDRVLEDQAAPPG